MTTPFRERPPMLACPRCGDLLNEVAGDVAMCTQCGGLWLGQPAIVTAFQDPTWPHGVGMWWRRELVCPACANDGIEQTMAAVVVGDLLLDRCVDHGLWLDRGELARLVGGSAAKELENLKGILESAKTPAWVVEEQQKRDAEKEQRELAAYRAETKARLDREAAEQAARDAATRKQAEAQLRDELAKEQRNLETEIDALVTRLRTTREMLENDEKQLREARARLRMVQNQLASLG